MSTSTDELTRYDQEVQAIADESGETVEEAWARLKDIPYPGLKLDEQRFVLYLQNILQPAGRYQR